MFLSTNGAEELAWGNAPGTEREHDLAPTVRRKWYPDEMPYSAALRLTLCSRRYQGRCPWLNYLRTFGAEEFIV